MYLRFILFLLLIPFFGHSYCQEYRNIVTSGLTFYSDSTTPSIYLSGIGIDSVIPQGTGDTIYLLSNTIRPYDGSSLLDTTGGILGRTVIKQNNGSFWFLTEGSDTVFLNTGATINESWRF